MTRSIRSGTTLGAAILLAFLLAAPVAIPATFVTNAAALSAGKAVTSSSSKNGNRTRFYFSNVTTNPETNTKAAFVQWAPLVPKARAYKNGTLVDKDASVRLWINGVWFSLRFDGEQVHIN